MRWQFDYSGHILGCGIILGNVLLGAVCLGTVSTKSETPPTKRRQPKEQIDPGTGIKYREWRKNPGEIIVQVQHPNGRKETYTKTIGDSKTAFENENLEECLQEEDLYDEAEQSIKQAISSKSIENLKKVLIGIDPQKLIDYCPNLLDEVDWCFDEMNANKNFRETTINTLKEFGCVRK
ncbi:MAG: hypothetical protein LBD60_02365 [Puniceicoccales bacterium]|jgi:hypothetical protein|nr:hypothetical protein [Puniceicoccales bacterium]